MEREHEQAAVRAADVVPPGSEAESEPSEQAPNLEVTPESQDDPDPGDVNDNPDAA